MPISFKQYLKNLKEQEKNDVSKYGDDELLDWFLNDEALYNIAQRANEFFEVQTAADEHFIYNDDQLDVLRRAWEGEEI